MAVLLWCVGWLGLDHSSDAAVAEAAPPARAVAVPESEGELESGRREKFWKKYAAAASQSLRGKRAARRSPDAGSASSACCRGFAGRQVRLWAL